MILGNVCETYKVILITKIWGGIQMVNTHAFNIWLLEPPSLPPALYW